MKRETHCGLLEFVADEGRIYIPYWVGKTKLIIQSCIRIRIKRRSWNPVPLTL